jgi:hypothetical protein
MAGSHLTPTAIQVAAAGLGVVGEAVDFRSRRGRARYFSDPPTVTPSSLTLNCFPAWLKTLRTRMPHRLLTRVKCSFNTGHANCIVISYLVSELSEARWWAVNRSRHTRIASRAVCWCLGINEEKPWFAAVEVVRTFTQSPRSSSHGTKRTT